MSLSFLGEYLIFGLLKLGFELSNSSRRIRIASSLNFDSFMAKPKGLSEIISLWLSSYRKKVGMNGGIVCLIVATA